MTTVAAAKPSRKSLLTFNVKAVLQLQDSYATFWLLCWRISWWLFKFKDLHKYTMKNCPNYLDDKIIAQCLKITLNVAFEFWRFLPIFGWLKVACLVTLFDCKLHVSKTRQNWPFFAFLNETFYVTFKHCHFSFLNAHSFR